MPTSAPGNKLSKRGFTLIELMVVLALIAIATAAISLSLRDPEAEQLEREAERLSALLESARAEARSTGLLVSWAPVDGNAPMPNDLNASPDDQFRFTGLPPSLDLPRRWLADPVQVEIEGATALVLGPEPMIAAQRLRLRLGDAQLVLATDGLAPFAIQRDGDDPATQPAP
ncbi:MAG TPA: prepilin-type N-terminal cleavage/methylation domain-containing protein [Burkholderiaceae bacterium]